MRAQGKVSFNWTHSWGGTGNDGGAGVAIDSAGNVYIAGSASGLGAGGDDALLLKYDPAGHLQWARTWGGTGNEGLNGVVVDGNGFIYAVGATNSFGAGWYDFLILKFDTAGNFVWARTWGGGSFDQGVDISFDQNGNLAIAGEAYSFGACTVLLKFSTDGAFLSARTWNGPATYDSAYSITVDANGNQILTGISWDYSVFPNHNTILVLKYDSLGNLLWSRNWAGPSEDEAYGKKAVRTDAQGNIYIAGRTSASCTNPNFSLCDFDVLLLKIDPNGNLAWAQKWGGTGWDTASGLVVDSENKLIVVGSTASFFGGLRSALIQKYDTTGAGPIVSRVLATSAASGWNGLVAGSSSSLVATGDGPNSGGTWQDTGISAVPASGSLSSPPYSVGAPTGTTGTPSGSTGDPTSLGVADTGGGGSDVLTAAFSFGNVTPVCQPELLSENVDFSDSCFLPSPFPQWAKTFGNGAKLEVTCELALNTDSLLPTSAYMAWYTDPQGNRSRIAQCLFHGGLNLATYRADPTGTACLASVDWWNLDGGPNDGQRVATGFAGHEFVFTTAEEPYLDLVRYHYATATNKLGWTDEKYRYRTDATASVSDLSLIVAGQQLPISGLGISVDPLVGPETEQLFDELWQQLQAEPRDAMRFVPGCDLNADGVCDEVDQTLLEGAIGACAGQVGYIQRLDLDQDGCITAADVAAAQKSFVNYRAGCTRDHGYWKTHPHAWPMTSLRIGGEEYSQSELLRILSLPGAGNGAVNLARQLIAAKLSIAAGASPTAAPIGSADALILNLAPGRLPPFGNASMRPAAASEVVDKLDHYNQGLLGPPPCAQ
jgi:hypothetical protein